MGLKDKLSGHPEQEQGWLGTPVSHSGLKEHGNALQGPPAMEGGCTCVLLLNFWTRGLASQLCSRGSWGGAVLIASTKRSLIYQCEKDLLCPCVVATKHGEMQVPEHWISGWDEPTNPGELALNDRYPVESCDRSISWDPRKMCYLLSQLHSVLVGEWFLLHVKQPSQSFGIISKINLAENTQTPCSVAPCCNSWKRYL